MKSARLFVYGSLRLPAVQAALLGHRLPSWPAAIRGYRAWTWSDLPYPAVWPQAGGTVQGQVLRVPTGDWRLLDAWEETPRRYRRRPVTVRLADGRTWHAEVYVAAIFPGPVPWRGPEQLPPLEALAAEAAGVRRAELGGRQSL
ncbi:MAG: gamma-glutamylcyclotransferase [Thermaerobacter sp.]|nr:gamma-glutamylcyclotransferase [Thermaerobacter sp.]